MTDGPDAASHELARHGYLPYAPGWVPTDGPEMVTSRFPYEDSFTLERSRATDGYEGLRAALQRRPDEVHAEVREATLLGRGGAGFPAGIKWGFCPDGVWPRYLVVNGDESEPGTYKDRLLMERDPHQLIEGCVIASYAVGLSQCFLYVRGEMALAQERIATALNEAYEAGYVGRNIMGSDVSVDIILHWGAGAVHRRRGDRADREPRGEPGDAAPQAAVLPGGDRSLRQTDDRQQRRDAGQSAVDPPARGRGVQGARFRDLAGDPDVHRLGSRRAPRCLRGAAGCDDVPRPALRRRVLPGHP